MNVTASFTQWRDIGGKMKTRPEDKIEHAATYYHGCRDMDPKAGKKIKSLILIKLLVYVGF